MSERGGQPPLAYAPGFRRCASNFQFWVDLTKTFFKKHLTNLTPYDIMKPSIKKGVVKVEDKIALYMKKYGITAEEAQAMIDYDKETDDMTPAEISKELTPEQRKAQKSMTITTSGKKVERKREHKVNERKKWFIDVLKVLFEGFVSNGKVDKMEVSNAERSIELFADGKHFTLTLTEHRQPK